MHQYYDDFLSYLDKEDRKGCIDFALSKLSNRDVDITALYEQILAPALRETSYRGQEGDMCVWREHVRTSIVRTVIECCYPYVVRERNEKHGLAKKGKVVVLCPADEHHEMGARMVADFFALCGFDAMFVGANTPQAEIVDAIACTNPAYVAISVTNYYNLLAAHKTIQRIAETRDRTGVDFRIIVGGRAFQRNPEIYKEMGADILLATFEDIERMSEGDS